MSPSTPVKDGPTDVMFSFPVPVLSVSDFLPVDWTTEFHCVL